MTPRNLVLIALGTLSAAILVFIAVAVTIYVPYRQDFLQETARLTRALEIQELLLPGLLPQVPGAGLPDAGPGLAAGDRAANEAATFVLSSLDPAFTYYVGRRSGDDAEVLYRLRAHGVGVERRRLEAVSPLATAIRRALDGEHATLVGRDDHGERMLYAFKRAPGHELALVAALPFSAVQGPAIHAVVVGSLLWLVTLTVLGMLYFFLSPTRKLLALRDSGYRAVVRSTLDAIIVIDRKGRIHSSNPAARRMFGFSAMEAQRKTVDDLWEEPHRVRRETAIGLFLTGGEMTSYGPQDVNAVRFDGEVFPALMQASGMLLEGEALLLLNLRDVTEQRKVEHALVEARNAAEKAAQDRARLLASISHEVRTPINGVVGMLDLLRLTETGSEQQHYLELAQASAASLLTLTNEVLDWARIESGRTEFERIVFAPAECVAVVVEAFRGRAGAKGLELDSTVADGVPGCLQGDPTHLKRIFSNLVDNAIKFTRDGRVAIRVAVQDRRDGRTVLRFEVSDTGPGVPETAKDRIFEPFSQAGSSSERLHGGSGLGLSICRSLVVKMGGGIGYDSVTGEGTTFWFTVPFDDVDSSSGQIAGS
jgi:PAS domain S-box-containing protein